MKKQNIGIVDFELYLPEETVSAEMLSEAVNIPANVLREKMGVNAKHVGGPEDHSAMMATKASKRLLEKTGTDPNELDMILYAGETYCEYICWTAAIKIQNELGADRAYAWDMGFRCAATPLALKVAKDMMLADSSLNTVLVTGGNTNAYLVDYQDKNQSFMFDMSPAGLALLLKKDHNHNIILETGIITDHVFCDDVIGKWGGSLYPITDEIASDSESLRRARLLHLPDPAGMKVRLGERSLPNFVEAVNRAKKGSGLTAPLDFIGITHINPKAHQAILKAIDMQENQSVYLCDDGHCGHVDQFLALQYGLERGLVKAGDYVGLLGAGTGYAFACTVVKWG
ncbi:MAG: 3-oxoacyl-[acyl-carrier-protein] synthase [Clostridiales bacterium]|jgi:3-oxoacyl-[acyl-carrier-protein] synthase-3|uniref:3-oxoacyl-ACP synthase n=1 Tax=Fusibacter paucivorans TaxID=76009 RepID=A0ABS5PJU9_9FIRM|nr:3-oxoacyl-ACP synthase [Fusibacter paucivorans]MBS7525413.1 3-oxoacyl-ACP synthase [Fusibacter paucivorans]MDK2867615.1 3-oxoacyl-[acyl-carrier-protein] synthase [Clostridiales bacterium]MDN5298494.1 3-oxoacyl-[acyl-carrier-protein] synthase [Clostridiales bacterium]